MKKLKKRSLVIIATSLLILSISIAYSFADSNNNGNALGNIFKKYKIEKEVVRDKVLIKEGSIEITQNDVDYQKAFYKAQGVDVNEDEIKNKLIIKELLLKEAKDSGISISDDETRKYMNEIREKLPLDKSGYEEYKSFMDSCGWTEDEYWEKSLIVYKNAYITGKYIQEVLKSKFKELNPKLSETEFQIEFKKYLEEYKINLPKKYNISY